MDIESCPQCGWDAEVREFNDTYTYDCKTCGRYVFTGILRRALPPESEQDKALFQHLKAYTRQASEAAGGKIPLLDITDWRDAARAHVGTPINLKLRKLMALIAKRSEGIGGAAQLWGDHDYPMIDARSKEEFDALLGHLHESKIVEFEDGALVGLTVAGWQQLEPITGAGIPGRVFVAMSFAPELDAAYSQGIEPALKQDCKLEPIHMKELHNIEQITDRILAEIKLAQFVVADFTEHKAGVYFEAGYAMGLGRPVVWTCRRDNTDKLHFDTRQFAHILWEEPSDLRQQLADRIRAVILR